MLGAALLGLASLEAAELRIGLDFTGSTFQLDSDSIPPDIGGAVGPEHIVELLNGRYSVYRKSDGVRVQSSSLTDFWLTAGVLVRQFAFNPRVLYDSYSERWFAAAVDNGGDDNAFLVAVSLSSDPMEGWAAIAVDTGLPRLCWGFFPTLGINADGIFVLGGLAEIDPGEVPEPDFNSAPFNCPENSLLVVPKQDLLGATSQPVGSLPAAVTAASMVVDLGASYQAIVDLDNGGMPATILHNGSPGVGTNFNFFRSDIVGAVESPQVAPKVRIPVNRSDYINRASQPPPKASVEIWGGIRFHSSIVRRNESFWGVHTVLDFSVGIRPTLRWFQIDAQTNEVLQDALIVVDGMDLYYGSIAVNEFDDVVIGFNGSSVIHFIGSYAVLGQTEGGVTTFGEPVLLQAGQAGYEVIRSSSGNRWGRYSSTVVDPIDPRVFWTFQEIVSSEDVWSTRITELAVFSDRDGDGIRDEDDACPDSDLGETVVIDGCDSRLANLLGASGCTSADHVARCAGDARNHGGFVSCVSALFGGAKGAVVHCAARADIP